MIVNLNKFIPKLTKVPWIHRNPAKICGTKMLILVRAVGYGKTVLNHNISTKAILRRKIQSNDLLMFLNYFLITSEKDKRLLRENKYIVILPINKWPNLFFQYHQTTDVILRITR